jgi:hypothetical protein
VLLPALQNVWHAVPLLLQVKPLQLVIVPAPHVPLASHVPALVSVPFLHEAIPQGVPGAVCSQLPLPSQLPSLPHGPFAAHWLFGACMPAGTLAQVPSALPVRALVQAMHVPVQALLQQTPSTQWPLVHPLSALHVWPMPERTHMPFMQLLLGHWPLKRHCTQLPLASQTVPLPELQGVPICALLKEHMCLSQVGVWQVAGLQSVDWLHPEAQLPLPSQNSPLSHIVPWARFVVTTFSFMHDSVTHWFVLVGTSLSSGTVATIPPMHCSVLQSFTVST